MIKLAISKLRALRKRFFKVKFLIFLFCLIFLVFQIYQHFRLPAYPFEPNQNNVNGLLTSQELAKIFKTYSSDLKCKNESNVLIAINSATQNLHRRQAIRETWSKWIHDSNQTLIFFLSESKDQFLQKEIELENYYYNDMIILPILESYYLLTVKTLHILNWSISQHCSSIKFLVKCDDDMFVNWTNLSKFLNANRNQTNAIFGKRNLQSRPNRDRFSRWFMPYEDYDKETYPSFAG